MNRKRLGQLLITGVFTACAVVITSLIELLKQEQAKPAAREERPEEARREKGELDS